MAANAFALVLAVALSQSFDVQVPVAPSPVRMDGRSWLIYEVHLTNFTREPLRVLRVDVLDAATTRVIHSYAAQELADRLALVTSAKLEGEIQSGQRAVMYVETALPSGDLPAGLRHRIEYADAAGKNVDQLTSAIVSLQAAPRMMLGPPLRGGPWVAIHHAQWPRGHRRVFYTIDGRARLPGRFAIDWVKLDDQGRQARGDPDLVASALGYGADVLAVADATVAAVRDDVQESDRVSTHPRHALADATGNYVALDLGDGRFAIYEHLKPRSVRVKQGERVRRGQVLASLGFTGDSTGPHLHFHVADSAAPLAAEGVPFAFERFEVVGRFDDLGTLGTSLWLKPDSAAAGVRTGERPAPNSVVTFGAE